MEFYWVIELWFHLSILDDYLGCFKYFSIINSAMIYIHIFYVCVCTCAQSFCTRVWVSLRTHSRSGIARLKGMRLCNFESFGQRFLQGIGNSLRCQWQCMQVLVPLAPLPTSTVHYQIFLSLLTWSMKNTISVGLISFTRYHYKHPSLLIHITTLLDRYFVNFEHFPDEKTKVRQAEWFAGHTAQVRTQVQRFCIQMQLFP